MNANSAVESMYSATTNVYKENDSGNFEIYQDLAVNFLVLQAEEIGWL